MLNSIIERHNKIDPLSDTEIQILRGATKLFLEKGFSKTTYRQIAELTKVGLGTITYHYKVKEDMLQVLMEELMDFHLDLIEKTVDDTKDNLLAYALEIAVQIALCENNSKAWDLYYSAYSHPATLDHIKDWGAKKNYHLFRDRIPDCSEEDFRHIENVTCGIELAAFTSPKNRYFSLNDKISLFLDSMMKMYDIPKEEREKTINEVLNLECEKVAAEMFDKFVARI